MKCLSLDFINSGSSYATLEMSMFVRVKRADVSGSNNAQRSLSEGLSPFDEFVETG